MRPLAFAALLAAACSRPEAAAHTPEVISVRIDGREVVRVELAELHVRPKLADLVAARAPVDRWRQVVATGTGSRSLIAARFDERYAPDQEAILFLDRGQPALGLFRRVSDGAPRSVRELAAAPTMSLTGVTAIDIRTASAPPTSPSGTRSIVLWAGDRRCELDPAELAERGDGPARHAGWDIRDLAHRCFGAAPATVRARAAGRALEVDPAALAKANRLLLVKVNRRGKIVMRIVEPGSGRRHVVSELIGAERIDLALVPAPDRRPRADAL